MGLAITGLSKNPFTTMRQMINTLITFALISICALITLYIFQRSLIYFPERLRTPPIAAGLTDITEQILQTPDGEKLIAWYAKATPDAPTILYFHGNGGSLRMRANRISLFQQHGFGILMPSYRSYSGSTGSPTEENLIADALLAYNWLKERNIAPSKIILYGESLGTGIAVQTAAQKTVAGLILESPYTSIVDIGARTYPFLPVRLLMKDHFNSMEHINRINSPLLIIHGANDAVVPLSYGKRLHDAANEPKDIKIYKQGNHMDLYLHGAWEHISTFIMKISPPR